MTNITNINRNGMCRTLLNMLFDDMTRSILKKK